jgi:hypothetical protein
MFCVRVLFAALLAAAASACLCDRSARADAYRRYDDTYLIFSGTDLWRHGSFSYGGLLWSPGLLDREGFTFKTMIGIGAYRYRSGALGNIDVIGSQAVGFAMPGWRFMRDKTVVSVFAGLDAQYHYLMPYDPGSRLAGTHAGIRGAIEFWYEPTVHTMWTADASASSIGPSYSGRIAYGWRFFDALYAGPEVAGFSNDNYKQFRAGLHLTGLKYRFLEWSAGVGWATDSDARDGMYGRIGFFARR